MFNARNCFHSVGLLLGLAAALPGHGETIGEYELKAALLFKFAQFTDWPAVPLGEFGLCVLGKDPFGQALASLEGKTLKDVKVVVKQLVSVKDAKPCQVLFLNPANHSQIALWQESLKGQPILTISDDSSAWDAGVMIALTAEPNRIAFSINASAARQVGMKFRAQMLQLAREVR